LTFNFELLHFPVEQVSLPVSDGCPWDATLVAMLLAWVQKVASTNLGSFIVVFLSFCAGMEG